MGVLGVNIALLRKLNGSFREIATSRYETERMFRGLELLVSMTHTEILQSLVLSPERAPEARRSLELVDVGFRQGIERLHARLPRGYAAGLDEAGRAFDAYFHFASTLLQPARPGNPDAESLDKLSEAKTLLDASFESSILESSRAFADSLSALAQAGVRTQTLAIGLALAFFLAAVPSALIFARRLTRPLVSLAQAAAGLASSDFSVRLPSTYRGEAATLSRSFNFMAERLQADFTSLEREVAVRMRAEASAHELRERLSTILGSLPLALVSLDGTGALVEWNAAAAEAFGLAAEGQRGRNLWQEVPWVGPLWEAFAYASANGVPSDEVKLSRSGSQERLYRAAFFPLRGNPSGGTLLRLTDVTEQERKERQLQRLQTMETIGTLAGGLAHDFNNILSAIMGSASLMEAELGTGKPSAPALRGSIDTIGAAANRASGIIKQLLALSRDQVAVAEPVDLVAALQQTIVMAGAAIDKSVTIGWARRPECAWVLCDTVQLEQVLMNLFINAAHAMTIMRPPGDAYGGRLTVDVWLESLSPGFVAAHPGAKGEGYWSVAISDTGVGIEEETSKHVFEAYFTTKEASKGSGLGLAMAQATLARFGGYIDLRTAKGEGATFTLRLIAGVAPERSISTDPEVVLGKGTVLVVDDEAAIRSVASRMLALCGYEAFEAAGGDEGIDFLAARDGRIDLVILDLSMPRKSGRETFAEMKERWPHLRILMSTGFTGDERLEDLAARGMVGVLGKPYDRRSLASAVAAALNC